MPSMSPPFPLRPMRPGDVEAVVAGQQEASIIALAAVFPQDEHPFPREEIARRWREEIAEDDTDCFVIDDGGGIAGFAVLRGDELVHFGVDLERWGTGLARVAHDALVDMMRERSLEVARLWVFTGNGRARSFYEKLGWIPSGQSIPSSFPPHPELQEYTREMRLR